MVIREAMWHEHPEVSVCIPTLDGEAERVWKALDALYCWTDPARLEVLVADCQRKLLGYTRPMNAAMAAAKGKYLVAMNDDVEVTDGWLEPMLEAARAGAWCVTPDATHTDGPQVFAPYCMLWRRDGWEATGGLDERFVLWGSDIDIARRLVDAGHPPVKVMLTNPVRHQLNATCEEHPQEVGPICMEDLDRFRHKWGVDAETMKHELAALVA